MAMTAAVVFYEYVISFDDEVRLVWRRKITGASVIFFLNRYLLVLQSVITVASYWPVSNPVCLLTVCAQHDTYACASLARSRTRRE